MDLKSVLVQLRAELQNVNAAILSLERLQHKEGRRGRPPAWLAELRKPKTRRRPNRGGGRDNRGSPEE